jgi:glycosyltransferase involved in cell wall biosynthesis
MRLLFVVHQFFPWCHSGTEQYCLATAREARRRGDEVIVLSLHWDAETATPPVRVFDEPYDGFRVLRLAHWHGASANDVLRDYDNPHLEATFGGVLDEVRPDAVHFFHLRQLGSNLIGVARQRNLRTVASLTDFWFACPRFTLLRGDGFLCAGPPDGGRGCVPCANPELAGSVGSSPRPPGSDDSDTARLRALLDRAAVQRRRLAEVDAVFAPSTFLAETLRANGFTHPRLAVLPYGLEEERVTPTVVARPRRPLRAAFCGVLSPWKAPRLAVEALRFVTAPIELRVHGQLDQPMFADYIATLRTAASADQRVTLPGEYPAARTSEVFADMDVLVVPSLWYENTPFVVLEAFAAGVPVVASRLGGLAEVVRDGVNGVLFRAGDARDLGAVLQRLAADPDAVRGLRVTAPPSIATNYDAFRAAYGG